MPAYWLARAKIDDPVEYKKYTDRLPALFGKYNAKVLVRGGDYQVLEGETPYERFVVIKFPSLADAQSFFDSPEYRDAAAFRRAPGVARNEVVLVEGGDATPN